MTPHKTPLHAVRSLSTGPRTDFDTIFDTHFDTIFDSMEKSMKQRFSLSNAQLTKRSARHVSDDEDRSSESPYKAVFYVDDLLDERRWRISRTIHASSIADARRLRDVLRIDIEKEMNEGSAALVGTGMTLRRWMESHIQEMQKLGRISDRTAMDYTYAMHRIDSTLADKPINSITALDMRAWVSRQIEEGAPTTSINKRLSVVKVCLNGALDVDLIPANPAARTKGPKQPKREPRVLTDVELDGLNVGLANIRQTPFGLAVRCALQAGGMRRSEVCALHVCDVLETTPAVTIESAIGARSAKANGSYLYEKETKTTASHRTVGIPKALWKDLLQRKRLVQQERPGDDKAYLLGSTPVKPMDPAVLSRTWSMFAKQNGFSGVRFHDLRHPRVKLGLKNIFNFFNPHIWDSVPVFAHASVLQF